MKVFRNLLVAGSMIALTSCAEKGPQEIAVGKDQCDNCKMTISDQKFATQLLTEKGRAYKFDDVSCLKDYENSNPESATNGTEYVVDFPSGAFIDSKSATFIKGGEIKSPMGGNTQAFKEKAAAEKAAAALGATLTEI